MRHLSRALLPAAVLAAVALAPSPLLAAEATRALAIRVPVVLPDYDARKARAVPVALQELTAPLSCRDMAVAAAVDAGMARDARLLAAYGSLNVRGFPVQVSLAGGERTCRAQAVLGRGGFATVGYAVSRAADGSPQVLVRFVVPPPP